MDLPTLDFSIFYGPETERQEFATTLVNSFRKHGFVKLINHGIPEETVKNYLSGSKQLFDLPLEAKRKIENISGPHPQRGWSVMGSEKTGHLKKENRVGRDPNEDLIDEREYFDAGPIGDTHYPNKWPDDSLPTFRPLMEDCYERLQSICLDIMEALELGLKLKPGALVRRCIPAASEIRLNHYPKISLSKLRNSNVRRTWPHTDFGIITLLFQDTVGGLELEDREQPGTFVPVMPGKTDAPSELVVNISDTFQRWTNNVISAGLHQVNVPASMKGSEEGICPDRYSSIFFLKADRDTSVGPLPEFVTKDKPALYDECTALEYQKRMTKILYKELDL